MGGGGGYSAEHLSLIQTIADSCMQNLSPDPLQIQAARAVLWGAWQVKWTPAETLSIVPPASTAAPLTQTEACITSQSWEQALKKKDPIPFGMAGKLVLANLSGEVSMVNLNGDEQKVVSRGDAPSISPDGSRIAMTGPTNALQPPNGLYITDVVSGSTALLPGTANGDSAPLWSPDGTRIAFTRGPAGPIGIPGPYNIMVVNVDGSDLRQVTFGEEMIHATAWTPDSLKIIYTVYNHITSGSVRMIDVQTGEVTNLFETSYGNTGAVVSPYGKYMAYEDWLPGEIYALYVSNFDGSNRNLLAQGNDVIVTIPKWSPDGQWVIVTVQSENPNPSLNLRLALIQVNTCQIIPLPTMNGYVGSWLP
jgi:TolB protein